MAIKRLMFNLTVLVVLTVAFGITSPPAPTSPPSILAAGPFPSTPAAEPPQPGYVLHEERMIGPYAISIWRNPASDAMMFDNILTISVAGQTQVEIPSFYELAEETGTDLTGEGHPDVVISVYTGGAHCCFSTIVYDLGPTLTKVLETPLSNCGFGEFQDLDGDRIPEFITCDDLFAYVYCCFAGSPAVKVVLKYVPGQGYVPASPRFPEIYSEDVTTHRELAETASPGEMCEWADDTKCAVLPLVLDYLYSGQANRAWWEFYRLYNYPDATLFRSEIEQAVSNSPLFVSAGPTPPNPAPPYYMLQLLTNCGPDWQFIGLLTEGQWACDPVVPHRDIFWLGLRLRETDLLSEDEGLQIAPEGCTTDCRLDVVRYGDNARVGSIRLDTTVGFPGQVYRINGRESAHWRLRGDLTWEIVRQ